MDKLQEWVDGFLLGDGHLRSISPKTAQATMSGKYEEWVRYALSGCGEATVRLGSPDREGRRYWQGWTRCAPELRVQRDRWYPDGKKHPPADLKITPTVMRLWFLGDGSNSRSDITIPAYGFADREIAFLVDQVEHCTGLRFVLHLARGRRMRMFLPADQYDEFFKLIGKDDPTGVYGYKFSTTDASGREAGRSRQKGSMRWLSRELGVGHSWIKWKVKSARLDIRSEVGQEELRRVVREEYRQRGTVGMLTQRQLHEILHVGEERLKKALTASGVSVLRTPGGHYRIRQEDVERVRVATCQQ